MKYLKTIIPSILIIWIISISCGWGPRSEDIRVYLFHPSVNISGDLHPFFYSTIRLNRLWNLDTSTVPEENIDEWYNYFNKEYEKEDIKNLIYNTKLEKLTELADREDDYYWHNGNDFGHYLKEKKQYDVIDYLFFAKKVEILLNEGDPWYGNDYDIPALEKLITEGKTKVEETKDLMLKQRYAYQVIVIMRYLTMPDEVEKYYEQIFSKIPQKSGSIIKYWALSHVAYCTQSDTMKSQMAFLDVFTNSTAKKVVAYQWLSLKYLDSIKNEVSPENHHKILIYKEFRNPGKSLEGLKKITEIDPNSENFNTLLIREVNKMEDWLLTRKYTKDDPAITYWSNDSTITINYKADFKYLGEFISFMESNLRTGKVENKAFWELILAHLYFIYETPQMAISHLNKAEKLVETDDELTQLRITRILVSLLSSKNYDNQFETKVWNDLSWLVIDKKYNQEKQQNFTNLIFTLQKKYHDKKMYDKAALFMLYGLNKNEYYDFLISGRWWDFRDVLFYLDKYATIEQIENFMQIVENKNKSVFEKFLLEDYKYEKDRFLELMGTIALRKNDFETAKKYYSQLPETFWEKGNYKYWLVSNPFVFHAYPQKKQNSNDYDIKNKFQFVELLQEKIKQFNASKGSEKSKLAVEIGNVYYNISFFGKSWFYVSYGKADMGGRLAWTSFNTYVNENYQHCTTALKYYESALKYAKEEDKPEILFVLAKIKYDSQYFTDEIIEDQSLNDRYNRWKTPEKYYRDSADYEENIFSKKLKTNFPNDYNYYLEECPGIEYF